MNPSKSEAQWDRVRHRIREMVGHDVYVSWLQPLQLDRVENGEVFIAARNRFMRDWLTQHYLETLEDLWREEEPALHTVTLVVASPTATPGDDGRSPTPATPLPPRALNRPLPKPIPRSVATPMAGSMGAARTANAMAAQPQEEAEQESEIEIATFSSPLDPRFTFANFITGKPNELAFAAAQRIAHHEQVTFNPLFLYGGVGLGKTHLMHAIAWELRNRLPDRKVLYLSAEKFMYQFVRALRFRDVMNFKELFRSVDVLLIDDVQFIADKDNTQEEFFHTFNALVDQRKQIVVSGDKSPSEMGGIKERLRSRLSWGLVVDIHPTTYELRLGILQAKAERLSVPVPREVIDFLANKITSNVRELEGALNRLVAHAELVGRRVSLESAHDLLRDLVRANDRVLTIEEIQKETASHFNVRLNDLLSPRRARHIARPRQVAMYLSKQLTARSLPEIGERFDKRDHTTVMHAVKRVEQLMGDDPSFRDEVERLRRKLTQ